MDTDNIARKLIGPVRLLAALRCSIVDARSCTYALPLFRGKCGWMLTPKPLTFIEHRSSIITRGIRRVELVAGDGIDGINREESVSEALATGTIACRIHRIDDIFGGLAFHA